jgi:hypothetical protein
MEAIKTTIGENFAVFIEYTHDGEDVTDIEVTSAKTGEVLNDLIFGSYIWDEAWEFAERRFNETGISQDIYYSNMRSQCHDTPYAF